MITKHDWDAALDACIAAERERLAPPPTPEEVVAYRDGQLPADEANRVRRLLVYYPELDDDARPRPKISMRHLVSFAAATLVGVLSAMLVMERREARAPHVHESRHELRVFRARGAFTPPAYELALGEERALIAAVLPEPFAYPGYRLEIVDLTGGKSTWRVPRIEPVKGALEVSISRESLRPGLYRLDVYGLDGEQPRMLHSHFIRVSHRPPRRTAGV